MGWAVYTMVAAGFDRAGFGFWRSFFWPVIVGQLIAKYARQKGITQ